MALAGGLSITPIDKPVPRKPDSRTMRSHIWTRWTQEEEKKTHLGGGRGLGEDRPPKSAILIMHLTGRVAWTFHYWQLVGYSSLNNPAKQ